jgi:hypothetical protein
MRTEDLRRYLSLTACLILVGCGRQAESHREVLGELKAIRSELASRQGTSARWAFANKREIETAIFQWSRDKMEEVKTAEALSPEVEEKIRQYEALQTELMHKQMETRGFRLPPRMGAAEAPATDKDVEALSQRVAEARAPVAVIVERRSRQAARYRDQYPIDRLVAEYVKDRYELVVDSNEKVLYRSAGEVPDITEGIIAFLKGKQSHEAQPGH